MTIRSVAAIAVAAALAAGLACAPRVATACEQVGEPPGDTAPLLAAAARAGDPLTDLLLARALRPLVTIDNFDERSDLPKTIGRLEQRALDAADDDWRVLAAMLIEDMQSGCVAVAAPDPSMRRYSERLLVLEPANGFAYVVAMAHAWKAGDAAAFLAIAARSAAADRYRSLYPGATVAMYARFGSPTGEPATSQATDAVGATLPPYQHVMNPCREARGALAQHCVQLGTLMMRDGDTLIDALFGAAIVESLGDDAQRADALTRRRELDWIRQEFAPFAETIEGGRDDAPTFLATMAEHGEIAAMRWLLLQEGISPVPSPDWVSGFERLKADEEHQ